MADNITTLTDTNFDEEVKGADGPVLVDFWAEWCGPCKMIAPILEEIATEQAGKLRIGKLNVDDAPATPQQFQVMSIPTLILFKDGEVAEAGRRRTGQGPAARGALRIPVETRSSPRRRVRSGEAVRDRPAPPRRVGLRDRCAMTAARSAPAPMPPSGPSRNNGAFARDGVCGTRHLGRPGRGGLAAR